MKRGRIRKRKVSYDFKHFRKQFAYKLLMIACVILFFIVLVYLLFFVLEKISKVGEEKGLEGELPSFGIFGGGIEETEFLRANCSDENLKKIWDYIFFESSGGITAVSDKNEEEVCNYSLMYKILDNNMTYFIFFIVENNKFYVRESVYGFYGNFTDSFLNILVITPAAYLESFFEDYVEEVIEGNYIYGYRGINNTDGANAEYHTVSRTENGTWGYHFRIGNRSYYEFEVGGGNYLGNVISSLIYENLSLDVLFYSETFKKPINLTQIKDIENIVVYGSKGYSYYLDLDNSFENLGYNDYNLSFSYKINESGVFDIYSSFFLYYHYIYFDTSNTIGGNFIMNITLSHPEWNNRENVTSNNFNVTVYGCLDSDKYDDKYEKGFVRNLTGNATDYCVDNSKIMEYYCSSQNIRNYSLSCYSGYYCSGGACVVNASVEHAPRFLSTCEDLEWQMNTTYVLDMKTCWIDDDNDTLTFRYDNSSEGNLTISRTGSNLTLSPLTNWNGTGYFYVYATDLKNESQGRVDFRVYKIVNVTIIITTNQTNVTANNTPRIKSSSPSSAEINISSNGSLELSIDAENYDSIKWYVDGVLVKSNVASYSAEGLSNGEHEIKVEVIKGSQIDFKIWSLNVSGGEETPKRGFLIYLVIIFVVVGILIIIVVFLIVKSIMEKKWDENVPEIKELKPGTRVRYVPPSHPINYFER